MVFPFYDVAQLGFPFALNLWSPFFCSNLSHKLCLIEIHSSIQSHYFSPRKETYRGRKTSIKTIFEPIFLHNCITNCIKSHWNAHIQSKEKKTALRTLSLLKAYCFQVCVEIWIYVCGCKSKSLKLHSVHSNILLERVFPSSTRYLARQN